MLDYLMIFNAYFYIYHENCLRVSVYSNGTCPELEIPPSPNEPYWKYTVEDPKIVSAVKTIQAYDIIDAGGGIIYDAGESVKFKTGFKASAGSSVKVTIDPSMLLLPYYAKTNVDPCNGGTFETFSMNYQSAHFKDHDLSESTNDKSITEPNYYQNLDSIGHSNDRKIVSVENREVISSLKAYPNPTNGRFNIDLPRYAATLSIEIFDFTGQKIFTSIYEICYTFNFDLSEYKPGLYLVKIKLGPHEKLLKISKI